MNTDNNIDTNTEDLLRSIDFKQIDIQSPEDMQEVVKQMLERIDGVMLLLKELQNRLDDFEESTVKPTGCGFSCSNNSFTL